MPGAVLRRKKSTALCEKIRFEFACEFSPRLTLSGIGQGGQIGSGGGTSAAKKHPVILSEASAGEGGRR